MTVDKSAVIPDKVGACKTSMDSRGAPPEDTSHLGDGGSNSESA